LFNLKPNKLIKGLIVSNSLKVSFVLLLLLLNKMIEPCINTIKFLNIELFKVLIISLLSTRQYLSSRVTNPCSILIQFSLSTEAPWKKKKKKVYDLKIMFNSKTFIRF